MQSQSYTANNAVATTTDAMGSGGTGGNVTTFSYDTANNPTQVQIPTGAKNTLAYGSQPGCGSDAGGTDKVTCITDAAGNKTGMVYDAAGNMTSQTQTCIRDREPAAADEPAGRIWCGGVVRAGGVAG